MWGSGNAQELHYIASGNRKLHTTKYVRTQEQLANGNVPFDQLTEMKRDEEIASIPIPSLKVGTGCGSHKDVYLNIKK